MDSDFCVNFLKKRLAFYKIINRAGSCFFLRNFGDTLKTHVARSKVGVPKFGYPLIILCCFSLICCLGLHSAAAQVSQSTRNIDPGMLPVRAGIFVQGSPKTETGRYANERQFAVSLPFGFYMAATEVTQGEWLKIVSQNPSYFSACGDQCPVDSVNWYEALAFANQKSAALGLKSCYILENCMGDIGLPCAEGKAACRGRYTCRRVELTEGVCNGYRLPTESEWEYVARAGSVESTFGVGRQITVKDIAHFGSNARSSKMGLSCIDDIARCAPTKVGRYAPSAWGHYDMHGNLREWIWDGYAEYKIGTQLNPRQDTGLERVIRGSSFRSSEGDVRVALRGRLAPGFKNAEVGFRLVRNVLRSLEPRVLESPTPSEPLKKALPTIPPGAPIKSIK